MRYGLRMLICRDMSIVNDKQEALRAVQADGLKLQQVSDALKNDFDVVIAAIQQEPWAVEYASFELRESDQRVYLEVFRQVVSKDDWVSGDLDTFCQVWVFDEFWCDEQFVKAACRIHYRCFEWAHESIQKITEFAIDHVTEMYYKGDRWDPWGEARAPEDPLTLDEMLSFYAPEVLNDRMFIACVVKLNPEFLSCVSKEFQDDNSIVSLAVVQKGRSLEYASCRLQGDREMVAAAIDSCALALEFASEELRDDKLLVQAAISVNHEALKFASERLQSDDELIMQTQTISSQMNQGVKFFLANLGNGFYRFKEIGSAIPDSKGLLKFPNGDLYDGEFLNGTPHGHGECRYKHGVVYDGEWKAGKKSGLGKLHRKLAFRECDNTLIYDGEWKEDDFHGLGQHWNEGDYYEGEWKDGYRHGLGLYKHASGCIYHGQYRDGRRHGRGTFTWRNGVTFSGVYCNDEPEEGVLSFDKTVIKGKVDVVRTDRTTARLIFSAEKEGIVTFEYTQGVIVRVGV